MGNLGARLGLFFLSRPGPFGERSVGTCPAPGRCRLGLTLAGALGSLLTLQAASPSATRFTVQASSVAAEFPFFSSRPLDVPDASVRRILVLFHGLSYNAEDYLVAGLEAADGVPGAAAETLVIAPQVLRHSVITGPINGNLLYWQDGAFWGSSRAFVGAGQTSVSISVFTVLDRLLADLVLSGRFPNLQTVVVWGHSAGGQLAQRYAAVGRFDHAAARARGIHLRYGVSAPSTFVYMDNRRPAAGGTFAVPSAAAVAACPDYDDYGTGLQAPFNYFSSRPVAEVRQQYGERIVGYVVGANDHNPNDGSLDRDCEAMLQGTQRVSRMVNYYAYLQAFYGPEITLRHSLAIEPGISHQGENLVKSPTGLRFLLDHDPRDTDRDGVSDWDEWKAGTDPAKARQRPGATAGLTGAGALRLTWPGAAGRAFAVQRHEGAGVWSEIVRLPGVDGPMEWSPGATTDPEGIFRLQVALD